jgi:hypothetical protein
VQPDPQVVQEIAHVTGGEAFTAKNATRLDTIYRGLGSNVGRQVESRQITSWIAIAAAALLLAAIGLAHAWHASLP